MSNFGSERSRMEILAEILEICRKPTAKARIVHKTSMSEADLHMLIRQLLKPKLLLEFGNHVKKFVTTEKGLEFIEKQNALVELLNP